MLIYIRNSNASLGYYRTKLHKLNETVLPSRRLKNRVAYNRTIEPSLLGLHKNRETTDNHLTKQLLTTSQSVTT